MYLLVKNLPRPGNLCQGNELTTERQLNTIKYWSAGLFYLILYEL